MKRKIIYGGVAFAVVAAAVLWVGRNRTGDSQGAGSGTQHSPDAPVPVKAVMPTVQRVEHVLRAVGSFLAEDSVNISPQITGPVAELLADEGAIVKQGQILLRIDPTRFRLDLDRAKADVLQKEAELKNQQNNLERKTQLFKDKSIPQAQYDDAVMALRLAEARLEASRAALALAEKNLKDCDVTAPLDGVISARMISVGEYAMAGKPVFRLVRASPLKLRFTLPERYANIVKTGQKVKLSVSAHADREFEGVIYFINPEVDLATRTLELKALVENKEGLLKPGFFARVSLVTDVNEQAVLVPSAAILMRGKEPVLFVVSGDRARRRAVRLGEKLGDLIEVIQGVAAHEPVVVSGQYQLDDNKLVQVLAGTVQH